MWTRSKILLDHSLDSNARLSISQIFQLSPEIRRRHISSGGFILPHIAAHIIVPRVLLLVQGLLRLRATFTLEISRFRGAIARTQPSQSR